MPPARPRRRLLGLLVAVAAGLCLGAPAAPAGPVTERLAPLSRYEAAAGGKPLPWARPPLDTIVSSRKGAAVTVRSGPGRGAVLRQAARTEFGTPVAMSVVRRRGRWLGVSTADRPNGRLGWVDGRSPAVRLRRTRFTIVVDRSARRMALRSAGQVVGHARVSVGRAGSVTPTGRFAVTDKLRGDRFGSYYGCCILALSGTQPNLPPGWPGGNRLAIHGTPDQSSLGGAVSAGCVHASSEMLERLMDRVPVGTPVIIRA